MTTLTSHLIKQARMTITAKARKKAAKKRITPMTKVIKTMPLLPNPVIKMLLKAHLSRTRLLLPKGNLRQGLTNTFRYL